MSTNVNAGALNTNAEEQAGERNRRGKVKGFFFLVDRSNQDLLDEAHTVK